MLASLIALFFTALIPILVYSISRASKKWNLNSFVLFNRTRFLLGGLLLLIIWSLLNFIPEVRGILAQQFSGVIESLTSLKFDLPANIVIDVAIGWVVGTFCVTSIRGN